MTDNEQISEKMDGEVLVVSLSGQYTGGEESDAFQDSLQRAVSQGIQKVVLDLGRVTYTNSSFVGGLLAAHTSLSRKGGEILLCDVPEALQKILQVTRLDNIFAMYETVDEALDSNKK